MARDNFEKKEDFMDTLKESLDNMGYYIIVYQSQLPKIIYTWEIVDPLEQFASLPKLLRKSLKAFILLKYPGRWRYFFSRNYERNRSIKNRCNELRDYINSLGKEKNIIILSRSAAGIVSSLVANDLGIKKLICLGYPFRDPSRFVEKKRFKHLRNLKTPFLILQGERDKYGDINEVTRLYSFAQKTSLVFIDTDHDFEISELQRDKVLTYIKDFISN